MLNCLDSIHSHHWSQASSSAYPIFPGLHSTTIQYILIFRQIDRNAYIFVHVYFWKKIICVSIYIFYFCIYWALLVFSMHRPRLRPQRPSGRRSPTSEAFEKMKVYIYIYSFIYRHFVETYIALSLFHQCLNPSWIHIPHIFWILGKKLQHIEITYFLVIT